MIAWLALKTGLSTLVVKLLLATLIAVGVLYGLRLWGNKQWYKGETAGRQFVTKEIEKQKKAEWAAREARLAQDGAQITAQRASVLAATVQLEQDRQTLARTLSSSLAAIQKERVRLYANAAAVPDSRIWDDLRAISRELASNP